MPIIINRKTGEVKAPEITQEQRDALWGELIRNYVRKHPEALSALEESPDKGEKEIEDTFARDAVSLRIGIGQAGK